MMPNPCMPSKMQHRSILGAKDLVKVCLMTFSSSGLLISTIDDVNLDVVNLFQTEAFYVALKTFMEIHLPEPFLVKQKSKDRSEEIKHPMSILLTICV